MMCRDEFLAALRARLSGLPEKEVEDRLGFYAEMIDDRVEEGLTEEEAVLQIGSVEDVAAQIVADIPFVKLAKEKIKPKRALRTWEILLLALGAPLWLSLLVAALSVVFALFVSVWSVAVALWSCFGALLGGGIGFALGGAVLAILGGHWSGLALVGAGLVCIGLSIFCFFGCKAVTKGLFVLTRQTVRAFKICLFGKGESK